MSTIFPHKTIVLTPDDTGPPPEAILLIQASLTPEEPVDGHIHEYQLVEEWNIRRPFRLPFRMRYYAGAFLANATCLMLILAAILAVCFSARVAFDNLVEVIFRMTMLFVMDQTIGHDGYVQMAGNAWL